MWELDHKEGWALKNWCFWTVMLEMTLESPLDCKEIKLPTSAGSWKKQESSRKISISALLTMPMPLTVWITVNCGTFWKRWEYHLTCLFRNLYAVQEATVRAGHETTDWFQIGKGVRQGCIFNPAYLTYMQSTSWETLGWRKHRWNQNCWEKYQ